MKAQFLKIGGAKDLEDFYRKYPTKEDFVAKCGKKLTKAQLGFIGQLPNNTRPQVQSVIDPGFKAQGMSAGSFNPMKMGDSNPLKPLDPNGSSLGKAPFDFGGAFDAGKQIVGGIQALGQEKENLKKAKQTTAMFDAAQMAMNSDRSAEELRDQRGQMQVNPWDNVINPENRIPGEVGSNILTEYGASIHRKKLKPITEEDRMAREREILRKEREAIKGKKAQAGASFTGKGSSEIYDYSPESPDVHKYLQPLDSTQQIQQQRHSAASLDNPDGINFGKYGRSGYFKLGPVVNGVNTVENTQKYPWNEEAMRQAMINLQKVNPGIPLKANYKRYDNGGYVEAQDGTTIPTRSQQYDLNQAKYSYDLLKDFNFQNSSSTPKASWEELDKKKRVLDSLSKEMGYPLKIKDSIGSYPNYEDIPLPKSLSKAQNGGFMDFMQNQGGGDIAGNLMSSWTNNSGGAQIGSGVADAVGMIPGVGPIAKMVAGPVLEGLGHLAFSLGNENKLGREEDKQEVIMNNMAGMNMGRQMNQRNNAFVENGGSFYEQGGSLDGQIQPLWGGKTQTLSYNPYAPGNGESVITKGNMHSEGGIGIAYGNMEDGGTLNNVQRIEAEHNEPIVRTGEDEVSIMGRLNLPKGFKETAEQTTGIKLSGNKFNTLGMSIGKEEVKANKLVTRNVERADDYSPIRQRGAIGLNTIRINKEIGEGKLASLEDVKQGAAVLQDAINQTADEMGVDAQKISSLDSKADRYLQKKMNKSLFSSPKSEWAQNGKKFKSHEEAIKAGYEPIEGKKNEYRRLEQEAQDFGDITLPGTAAQSAEYTPIGKAPVTKNKATDNDKYVASLAKQYPGVSSDEMIKQGYISSAYKDKWDSLMIKPAVAATPDELIDLGGTPEIWDYASVEEAIAKGADPEELKTKSGSDWWKDALNMLPGMFQKSDAENFNNRQLMPELFAMSNNQLEPVEAQKFRPRLDVPYDISLQDQLNENTANARSAERLAAYNPGMLANLKSQEYLADQRVLGEQFRLNQAKKDQVYSKNRDILNNADLKNLEIMDQQYQRQALAKSNTKATTQSALSSISDKLAKHALENKTLRTWENMYDYRFDPAYRAHYQGRPLDVNNWSSGTASTQAPEGYEVSGYDKYGRPRFVPKGDVYGTDADGTTISGAKSKQPSLSTSLTRNGGLVKKYKKFK